MTVLLLPRICVQGDFLLKQTLHLSLGTLWTQICKGWTVSWLSLSGLPLRTLHILAGTRIRGQLNILRRRIVQTDDGQVVTVHQLDKHTRDLQTDVEVGEGHVHLQGGESESTLCFPHDERLVIAAGDSSGA